jgi:hypothetical protein
MELSLSAVWRVVADAPVVLRKHFERDASVEHEVIPDASMLWVSASLSCLLVVISADALM